VAIQDILNRAEIEYFAKAFKLEIDYFNRDLSLLFNNKVKVIQPAYDYLVPENILPLLQKQFILIVSRWEGACPGETLMIFQVADAKALCGFKMMMSPNDIKKSFTAPFGADDAKIFKEIAGRMNDSLDNALRENFNFDFNTVLKESRLITLQETGKLFKQIFTANGYMSINSTLKIADFPDGVLRQYIPHEMIKKISDLQKLGDASDDKEQADEVKKSILIVDADPAIREKMKSYLKELNFTLLDAGDGVEAMQILIRSAVGLIVLDFEMPNLNGVETCQRIKQDGY